MANTNDLLNRINKNYSKMSKGQKLLATYITDNYDKAVFLTAAKIFRTTINKVAEMTLCAFFVAKPQPENETFEGILNNVTSAKNRNFKI